MVGDESGGLNNIPLHQVEVEAMRRDLIDLIIRTLLTCRNYFGFKYRELVGMGLPCRATSDISVHSDGASHTVKLTIAVTIDEEIVRELALARKMRRFKIPREHPTTRRPLREAEELNSSDANVESYGGAEASDSGADNAAPEGNRREVSHPAAGRASEGAVEDHRGVREGRGG